MLGAYVHMSFTRATLRFTVIIACYDYIGRYTFAVLFSVVSAVPINTILINATVHSVIRAYLTRTADCGYIVTQSRSTVKVITAKIKIQCSECNVKRSCTLCSNLIDDLLSDANYIEIVSRNSRISLSRNVSIAI